MAFKWRKWNNILHRDIGYLAVGMCIIYALSGIALNHVADWNPSYHVTHTEVTWPKELPRTDVSKETALEFLETIGERDNYKSYFYPQPRILKIFVDNGSVTIDMYAGVGFMEKLERRPVFFEVNFLHYNPKGWWTTFSDIFCGALIFLAVSGLFVLKGKKGIKGRGAWMTALGIILPILFLWAYL